MKIKYVFKVLFFFLFTLISNISIAKVDNETWKLLDGYTKGICKLFEELEIPAEDMPKEDTNKSMKNCDADNLYFGFTSEPDYKKARYCALANHYNDTLTMIYANGKGVKKNIYLAIHLACQYGAAAEITSRVEHLIRLKKDTNSNKDFNVCDDITSGVMMGHCARLAKRVDDEQQKAHMQNITKQLTISELESLQKLKIAAETYFNTRIENELDQYGSGAEAFMTLELMSLNEIMVKLLDKTISCNLPAYDLKDYQKIDQKLNILYRRILKMPNQEMALNVNGIKKTEFSWVRYKESWSNFGHIKCPKINQITWSVVLTEQRIKQLRELSHSAN